MAWRSRKTALAVDAAYRVGGLFPDGSCSAVAWAIRLDRQPVTPKDGAGMLSLASGVAAADIPGGHDPARRCGGPVPAEKKLFGNSWMTRYSEQ